VTTRPLTEAERNLAASVFGSAIDYERVRLHNRKWFPFQPKNTIMAPDGDVWIPPSGGLWRDSYADAHLGLQGLFIHEMTHVWQAQTRGKWYLVLMRHPFCRYGYSFKPGRPLERYGLEQQAEIVRHAFLLRNRHSVASAPPLQKLEQVLPFASG
jgi:hypothetical protein